MNFLKKSLIFNQKHGLEKELSWAIEYKYGRLIYLAF